MRHENNKIFFQSLNHIIQGKYCMTLNNEIIINLDNQYLIDTNKKFSKDMRK